MEKHLKIECKTEMNLPLADLNELQGNLKTLAKTEYEKLRRAILDDGFSFAVHVWKSPGGQHFILDGHQRLRVVRKLVQEEGYAPPVIPVVEVAAIDYDQAKRKLLTAASNYGKGDDQGLYEFLQDTSITPDEIAGLIDINGIDTLGFIEGFYADGVKDASDASTFGASIGGTIGDAVNNSGAEVKMVQLFLKSDEYDEFMDKAAKLQEVKKTEHLSQTILEIVREEYTAQFPNES